MNKSPPQQALEIKLNLIRQIWSKKSLIETQSTQLIKDSFFDFARPPIGNGESQDSSLAELQIFGTVFAIVLAINTDHAKYFINPQSPKNPNYKYGDRNPLEKAQQKIIKTINDILNAF